MHINWILLALALTAPATLAMVPPKALAVDGTLYEVSEAINLKSNGYKTQGAFQGVFRIPFLYGPQPSYLLDDGRVVPLELTEYSIGQPTPRLELTFKGKK